MNYKVESIPLFDKQAKRLAKKYPSLKNELAELINILSANPEQGTSLGNGFFKIRISIASKGKGKSGGARVTLMLRLLPIQFFFPPFTIKLKKLPSAIKN